MQVLRVEFLFAEVLDRLFQSLTCGQLDYNASVLLLLQYYACKVLKDFRVLGDIYEKR